MKILIISFFYLMSFNSLANEIMAHNPYVRLLPPTSKTTAVFMDLMNHTDKDMTLIEARSKAAQKVEIHNHIKENGVMKMRQVKKVDIKKHKLVEFRPGGLHIMLINLNKPLVENEKIELELIFKDQKVLKITAPVKKITNKKDKAHHHH